LAALVFLQLLKTDAKSIAQGGLIHPGEPPMPAHALSNVHIDGMCDARTVPILGPLVGSQGSQVLSPTYFRIVPR
jgi:hypothetical protein